MLQFLMVLLRYSQVRRECCDVSEHSDVGAQSLKGRLRRVNSIVLFSVYLLMGKIMFFMFKIIERWQLKTR